MSGSSSGPPGGPAGLQSRSNKPEWLLSPDDLGQVVVLVLRRKPKETETEGKRIQDDPLPDGFIVGTSIELVIGAKEARSLNASREGRGSRYLLRTSSKTVMKKLTSLTELTDGTKVEIAPHPTLNTVQGVVYDPDTINKDETSILEALKSQGVHAVRRIKKRVSGALKNTPLLTLSFRGTILPEYVYFGVMRIKVRVYYPSPMLCFNCGFYGHSRKFCQQTSICLRCSAPHETPDGEQCEKPPNCLHCKTDHQVTSRDCPKYKQEEKIVRLKIDNGISFAEARRMCAEETKEQTFAGVVQQQVQQELATKDQIIATLQKQVAMLTKEVAVLRKLVKPRAQSQSPAPLDSQPSASNQTPSPKITATPVQQKPLQDSTDRLSRKDQTFISPPPRKDNRKNTKSDYDIHTRSRSSKRPMETSPNEAYNSRGKRSTKQPTTGNTTVDTEMNNGPGIQ